MSGETEIGNLKNAPIIDQKVRGCGRSINHISHMKGLGACLSCHDVKFDSVAKISTFKW